ncbi:MAG TPA: glycine betaine ABC transporter substrate-binding protein [Ilumatobacteraceae bacterium]|nr:glycine betaine ABC transporter substrate-binding protein [Ilumatobacteraceae bacterium]
MRVSSTIKLSLVAIVFLAACGSSDASDTSVALKPKITISSTTDPISETVAEIYGQALEKADFRVARKQPFATGAELMTALANGDVQMTGVTSQGLFGVLQDPSKTAVPLPNTTSAQAIEIAKLLPSNLKMGTPSTAEDKDVVFCAKTFTDTNSIATLTDLGTKPGLATLAAPEGFDTATPLGGAALKDLYNIDFKSVVTTPADQALASINAGTADCGIGRAADPALGVTTVVVLNDDKALVPNDVILPVMGGAAATDDVVSVLDETSARLTPDSLRALTSRLKDGATPEIVANEFIGAAGQG